MPGRRHLPGNLARPSWAIAPQEERNKTMMGMITTTMLIEAAAALAIMLVLAFGLGFWLGYRVGKGP